MVAQQVVALQETVQVCPFISIALWTQWLSHLTVYQEIRVRFPVEWSRAGSEVWSNAADCKSAPLGFGGSNPPLPINNAPVAQLEEACGLSPHKSGFESLQEYISPCSRIGIGICLRNRILQVRVLPWVFYIRRCTQDGLRGRFAKPEGLETGAGVRITSSPLRKRRIVRLSAPVLKTGDPRGSVGSNPTASVCHMMTLIPLIARITICMQNTERKETMISRMNCKKEKEQFQRFCKEQERCFLMFFSGRPSVGCS